MNSQLYRLVYCSRNRILTSGGAVDVAAEIQKILENSRSNNPNEGVTGALLYNNGNFAQVLEGPVKGVEDVFEKIQRDPRHGEVTVVESGLVDERHFPWWSMAFAGDNDSPQVQSMAEEAFGAAFAHTASAGTQLITLLRTLILQEDDWILAER